MKKKSDEILFPSFIMNSDNDQPIVRELYAGISVKGELIVCIKHTDYDDKRYNCSTCAVISRDETKKLARKLKVKFQNLPRFISDCMSDWDEIVNPTIRQVYECFKEVTECILDEGCRFKIKRKYGLHGYMCC